MAIQVYQRIIIILLVVVLQNFFPNGWKQLIRNPQKLQFISKTVKKTDPTENICKKKTKEEIVIEESRLKRLESKKQTTYSEDTKFMFVITPLPSCVSAEKVLGFYRLRWQMELVFKSYKSLLGLGNIPTKTKESSEVWLNGKMLLALLTEKYLGDIDFSPS